MIGYKKNIFALFAGLLFSMACMAQQKDIGSWNSVKIKAGFNSKWSASTDFLLKSLSLYDRFYYYEIKGGITYSLLAHYSFTLGTGFYNTFNEGEKYEDHSRQKEVRLWQQFTMNQKLSVIEIEHRYTAEQRFRKSFENRFRYRLNVTVPINKREITNNTLFASVYDELFFSDHLPHFSRNRFQAGLGYAFTKNIYVQSGWLREVDFYEDQTPRKNYLMISFSYKL